VRLYSNTAKMTATILVSVFTYLTAQADLTACESVLVENKLTAQQASVRQLSNKLPNFLSDRDYVVSYKNSADDGVMKSTYDSELSTRIYFSNSSTMNLKTGQPEVRNPKSKALFIFFHGSGTAKSSGRNFKSQFNQLAELGYSSLAMDMPFHMDGPISDKFRNADYFMSWINRIVSKYRSPGVPVYMVGHSFGPDVIAEYLRRYPTNVAGAALLSPAGFNPELEAWQKNYTEKMKFGGEVAESTLGGRWAAQVASQFQWTKGLRDTDPTQINPNLKVRVLSGDREEYVPGPVGGRNKTPIGRNTYNFKSAILTLLKNAVVTIEPGVGHYLFSHRDSTGAEVVMREILALVDVDVKDAPAIAAMNRKKDLGPIERLEIAMANDELFYSWILQNSNPKGVAGIIANQQVQAAEALMKQYSLARDAREKQIIESMETARVWSPAFYAELLSARAKNFSQAIFLKYSDYISRLSVEDQQRFGLIRQSNP
jgi:pimeloyl-ACP methyl ester carboxylesterase